MGFRNPIITAEDPVARAAAAAAQSTASAAQTAAAAAQTSANNAITLAEDPLAQIPDGALPGSKLAADAIDGRTITGSTIRTAAAGQRVQLDSTNGVVGYNAAGQAVTQIRPSDGTLIAAGATITGTLDTRGDGTTGAGVRIYETTDPDRGYPIGVIEWDDGVTGDTPAQAIQTVNPSPKAALDAYGRLALKGGAYSTGGATLTAPELDLEVGADPVSGAVSPQARLRGGALIVDRPIKLVQPTTGLPETWTALPIGPAWTAWDTTTNNPQYRRDATGEVHVRGMVKLAAGQSIAAGATLAVANMPAGYYLPGSRAWRWATLLNASGFFVAVIPAWVDTNGALTVYNTTAAAATAGYGFTLGLSFPTT